MYLYSYGARFSSLNLNCCIIKLKRESKIFKFLLQIKIKDKQYSSALYVLTIETVRMQSSRYEDRNETTDIFI